MSSPESRPDYAKLAEDALSDVAADDGMWNAEDVYEIARALQACAADFTAAEKERDEAQKLAADRLAGMDRYIFQRDRAEQNTEAAEADCDRLAAALEEIARGDSFGSIHLQEIAREALTAKEQP